jgi:hypothetical protein
MVEAKMPNRRHCLITLATLSFVALAAISAAAQEKTAPQADRLIVPGERIGPLRLDAKVGEIAKTPRAWNAKARRLAFFQDADMECDGRLG